MDHLYHHTMGDIVVQTLVRIGPDATAAIEPIASLVKDERLTTGSRIMAIEALARIGGPDHAIVADTLRMASKDPDPQIGLKARQALQNAQAERPAAVSSVPSPS